MSGIFLFRLFIEPCLGMSSTWNFHGKTRLAGGRMAVVGSRVLPTLLSIAIIAATHRAVASAFVEGNDAKFDTGSVAADGAESASSSAEDLSPWDNGVNAPDTCAHRRDMAQACFSCQSMMPLLGISAWQCCHDAGARRVCAEAAAVALYGHPATMSGTDEGNSIYVDGEPEDIGTDEVVEKRAKYFLGKRAKYFLGKRAFGERRLPGGHRPAMKHDMMTDDFALYDGNRRLRAAEKRAKYFLG